MSQISNRFIVTAIDDGTTLHGELRTTESLSQAWANGAAVPSWSATGGTTYANSPIVYLTLMEGTALVQPVMSSIEWRYNGNLIQFQSTETTITIGGIQRSGYKSTDGLFFKSSYPVVKPNSQDTVSEPALGIIGNLVSSDNLSISDISISGQYQIGDAYIDFSSAVQVRFTEIASNGYFGQISFVGGVSDITDAGQTVTAYGRLYTQDGNLVESNVPITKWYLNDTSAGVDGTTVTIDGMQYKDAFQISETRVVDYATVRCDFYHNGAVVFSAIEGIDDRQDKEYLYTQADNAHGNSASLHDGDQVTFKFFVGRSDNPTPDDGKHYAGWAFKVKLYRADGQEVTGSISGIPDVSGGYRPLTVDSNREASLLIIHDTVKTYFNARLSGIIYATKS